MRGDVVFRVYGVHEGRAKDNYFGAFRTRARAEEEVAKLLAREMHGTNWAARYHNRGFEVREVTVDTVFELPSRPNPRDGYFVRSTPVDTGPHTWSTAVMEVFTRTSEGLSETPSVRWERNHAPFHTFEPFRQGARAMALMSREYTRSAVVDLVSGEILAEEEEDAKGAEGFCPVGFYVPDWWDVHDDSIIPGSEYWRPSHETPRGDFAFVWGCVWGDDASWKLQSLDLRDVQRGVLRREARFGYLPVTTDGWVSPCFDAARTLRDAPSRPPPFLSLSWSDAPSIDVRTELTFDLTGGGVRDSQREILEALLARR